MLRLPVTTVGTIGDLLILQSAAGLIELKGSAPAGLRGELTILPDAKQFRDGGPVNYPKTVRQSGQLARLTGPDGESQVLILPRGIELPEQVALVLRLDSSADVSTGSAADANRGCPCPNFDPEEVAAMFVMGKCPP